MRNRNVTQKTGKRARSNDRKPFVKVLVAMWDKDPKALQIDVTPVDLSGSCCPLCGCNSKAGYKG